MKNRGKLVTVPVSRTAVMGRRDDASTLRHRICDEVTASKAKAPVFIGLQQETKRHIDRQPTTEDCTKHSTCLGRAPTDESGLPPELREWIDRVIVPALLRVYREERNHASKLPPEG
jgi:hypothetical protein